MMPVSLNPASQLNAQGQFNKIFDFFQNEELDADSPYNVLEQAAIKFVEENGEDANKDILNLEYSPNNDLFIFHESMSTYERNSWLFGFQNFYSAVNYVLKGYKPLSLASDGAKPQYVLKKDAFDYMGHNDQSIMQSRSSYASLFYH